ncbi:hypothetical protein SAY86_021930 [Trapa natans]|uniref:Uncharacterized protein n=1 Tax=Trapa natans TaxID=22666 RepID=A0AAN7MZY7_TRANT|nr:hypothetical protein SAY86_021930 [Trapa natans]
MMAEVQRKTFFTGYHLTNDINEMGVNRTLQLSCNKSNTNMKNGNQLNLLPRWPTSDVHFKCEKEELKKMILKQESIFRHQLHDLHRLYRIQSDLMNRMKFKGLCKSVAPTSPFQSNLFSLDDERKHHCPSEFLMSTRIPTSEESGIVSEPKVSSTPVRRLFDLELPADEYIAEEDKLPPCSKSGLHTEKLLAPTSGVISGHPKEIFNRRDNSTSSLASFHERGVLNNFNTVLIGSKGNDFFGRSLNAEASSTPIQAEFKKVLEPLSLSSSLQSSNTQTSQKIFGVEICKKYHIDKQLSFHPTGNVSAGSNMSYLKPFQDPKFTHGELLVRGTDGFGSFDSNVTDNSKSPNLDASGIKYSAEMKPSPEVNMKGHPSSLREVLDLNICPSDEEASSTLCYESSHAKPVRGEINLEAPVLEIEEYPQEESTDSKQGSSVMLDVKLDKKEEDGLLRVAAETLLVISSTGTDEIQVQTFRDKSKDAQSKTLQWFAEIIASSFLVDPETDPPPNRREHDPEGMDYFEFATLNLAETKTDEPSYKSPFSDDWQEKLFSGGVQKGRTRRGRQKKDFQKDVLPGLTSLSRSQVTEDLQMIEGLMRTTGRALRPELQKRNGTGKGSKARGRASSSSRKKNDDLRNAPAYEKLKCQEMVIEEGEGGLVGWGKRARRPKRPRCSMAVYSLCVSSGSFLE